MRIVNSALTNKIGTCSKYGRVKIGKWTATIGGCISLAGYYQVWQLYPYKYLGYFDGHEIHKNVNFDL